MTCMWAVAALGLHLLSHTTLTQVYLHVAETIALLIGEHGMSRFLRLYQSDSFNFIGCVLVSIKNNMARAKSCNVENLLFGFRHEHTNYLSISHTQPNDHSFFVTHICLMP